MRISFPIVSRRWFIFGVCWTLGLGGCMTPYDYQARQDTAQREDTLLMMEQVRRLEGRMEGLDMQVESLNRGMDGTARSSEQNFRRENESLRASVSSLESRIGALEAARERDRKEIVDKLTQRITKLMGDQTRSRPAPAPRGASSDYGFEHVVQPGETLSAIAQAYGATVQAIVKANGMDQPDQLRVGQKLFIPE